MHTTLLIDGDVFAYQAALAAEKPINWGDGLWTLHAEESEAIQLLEQRLNSLKKEHDADMWFVALSCPTEQGFRRQLEPSYKANRNNVRKPLLLNALREYLVVEYGATCCLRLEADDLLGIWATDPKIDGHKIVVSIDKDFLGVPCNYYRLSPGGGGELHTVTQEQADRYHLLQTLTGDATDGYKGVPGVGPVKAEKILNSTQGPLWPAIVEAYEKAGLCEEVALRNARLARILRHGEHNPTTNKIKLWTPQKNTK